MEVKIMCKTCGTEWEKNGYCVECGNEICINCGAKDYTAGSCEELTKPCPKAQEKE